MPTSASSQRFEVIVCEGTDFVGVLPALDFELNANLANQLGCPVLVVLRGSSVTGIASAVRVARASLARRGCSLFGVIVNRFPPTARRDARSFRHLRPWRAAVRAPENSALGHPTVAQVANELDAEVLVGGKEGSSGRSARSGGGDERRALHRRTWSRDARDRPR